MSSMKRVELCNITTHASHEVRQWASQRLRTHFRDPCFAMGILDSAGNLIGAAIYNDYDQSNVELTMVGKFPRHAVGAIFTYGFDYLHCRRMSLTVPEGNQRLLKLCLRAG